jgi:hypothetical protein
MVLVKNLGASARPHPAGGPWYTRGRPDAIFRSGVHALIAWATIDDFG